MRIFNFKESESIQILKHELNNYFTKDVLVINDTRGMILSNILPFIEFVGSYDQRILSMIKNTNIIFSKPFNYEILNYYNNFGLSKNLNIELIDNDKNITLAKNISKNAQLLQKIKNMGIKKIIPFFVNDDMEDLSNILNIPLIVNKEIFNKANNKLLLKQYLEKEKLPTISGFYTSDIDIIKQYFLKSERYLFKDPLGVSGYGFWDNTENKIEDLELNYGGKEISIEKFIQKKSSPSVQFFIGKENIIIFGITDQILENGKIYLGNSSPSIYTKTKTGKELISQSIKIIDYIYKLGYIGFGGIDFIVDVDKKVFATEVNARFTGATYPTITSMLLKGTLTSKWEIYNYEGEKQKFSDFIKNNSIKNKNDLGIFPLGLSGLELFGKANLLKFN